MLCYTIKNRAGEVGGTYTGRFSFLHCATEQERRQFVELRDRENLKAAVHLIDKENTRTNKISWPRVLIHEYLHKRVFERSTPGLIINGWRSIARVRFLYMNDEAIVRKYYAARTIYFRETEELQENTVRHIEGVLKKDPNAIDRVDEIITNEHLNDIHSADARVLKMWKRERVAPVLHERIVSRWLGKKFNEHFAIFLSYFDQQGQIRRHTISDGGVVNDVFDVRANESEKSKTTKKLLRKIIIKPTHGMEGFRSNLRWAQLSARTQQRTLEQLYGIKGKDFYEQTVKKVCAFVLRWSGVPAQSEESYAYFIQDLVTLDERVTEKRWGKRLEKWSTDPLFKGFVNYFYLHGN